MATIKTLVTYLEMCERGVRTLPALPASIDLQLIENINVDQYISLYRKIGKDYCWTSRLLISKDALKKIIHHPNIRIYQMFENNIPIGFFELSLKNIPRSIEISFIGLVDDAIGKGLGRLLTEYAIAYAWAQSPGRVIIQTCTLDHKRALPLYQKLGFKPYNRHVTEFQLLDE